MFGFEFTLLDVVDILLVFFLLYGCYYFIKGTRALHLLGGIVVLFALFLLANLFQLRTVVYLFQYLWNVGFIFLIIVFQDEIRSALMSLGRRRWAVLGHLPNESIIESVMKAVENLSKREVGGLLVLEQEVGLKNYTKSGTELDAKLTHELIESIFMSKGPLHDGAAVLQDERVLAAGCILPLSDRENLPRKFGTRHRAAVGMSEETDALVITISEETGAITYSHRGEFETDIDLQALEDELYEEMVV